MPKLPPHRNPKHSPHASGRGRVELSGQTHYTGPWGTAEADAEYLRLIGLWNANGRNPLREESSQSVGDVARRFAEWAEQRYRKRGEPTSYARQVRQVMRALASVHEGTAVADFGPVALDALRRSWLVVSPKTNRMRTRGTVGCYAAIVVDCFRWAASRELVPESAYRRLATLEPLSARDGGRETEKVASVPAGVLEASEPALPRVPMAILRVMALTGMRPAEACAMGIAHLDRSGDVWAYRVPGEWNKTEHHGRDRLVYIGPRAIEILSPFVSEAERLGVDPLFRPARGPRVRDHYLPNSLYRVVNAALAKRGMERFSPNQLRHSALTGVHRAIGLEHARDVAGHADSRTTLIYIDPEAANADQRERAKKAAREMG